ncbi:DUF6507 family protein [Streptomyces albus]|uniref:DUF6507 family protein n=1 Tax=Streptomyces albus TaxID=1888 RepID=UPI00244672CE|nr:DUF6507 family protein [Streptomyces albus]
MPGWDITPSGVSSVTALVETAIEGVEEDLTACGKAVENAAASAGTISGAYCGEGPPTGAIALALAQFVEGTAGDAAFIGARAVKSVNGAREATAAYVGGDLGMAAELQRAAARAPVVDLPGQGAPGGRGGAAGRDGKGPRPAPREGGRDQRAAQLI